MFGNKSKATRNWRYDCDPPPDETDRLLLDDQFRGAHQWRNFLCELEIDRRTKVDATIKEMRPQLRTLELAFEEADTSLQLLIVEMKREHARTKSKRTTRQYRPQVKELREQRKIARQAYYAARKECFADPEIKAALDQHSTAVNDRLKAARKESEVYWASRGIVEAGCQSFRSGPPPRFRGYRGEGQLAVQMQGGCTPDDLVSGRCAVARIDQVEAKSGRRGKRGGARARLWFRLGSDGHSPVWVRLPIHLHRPLPDDARIKWVYLCRRKVGPKLCYQACFVLEKERQEDWHSNLATGGACGIDLGWRLLHDGSLRVAYLADDCGHTEELRIGKKALLRWDLCRDLQSIRTCRFQAAVDELRRYLQGHRKLPDWLVERTKHLRQWRSEARLAALVIHWRSARFGGDTAIFDALEEWRKKDKHLWTWQVNNRRKAIAWRNDLYRNFARRISKTYKSVALERINWKRLMQVPGAEEEGASADARRFRAAIASPGILSRYLREACPAHQLCDPKDTTMLCHRCGKKQDFDAETQLRHRCTSAQCVAEDQLPWDQDYNAAMNLLAAIDPHASAAVA